MGNVLSREKREQVIALGRLGWSLRRIKHATGVRRETASDYLRFRDRDSFAGKLGREVRGKSGHFGDHLLWRSTTGQQLKTGTSVITGFLPSCLYAHRQSLPPAGVTQR